jgi:hypothetical protein
MADDFASGIRGKASTDSAENEALVIREQRRG